MSLAQAQKLEERVLLSAAIIDDSDPGFSTIGDWVDFTNSEGAGREENFHYTTALDTGIEVARWSFEDLEDGSYRVSTTWWASINRTTAAHYTLLDDVEGNVLGAADINQRVTPNDFTSEDSAWEDLGYVNIVNGKLVIELSNQSNVNQYVIADAVRIERVGNLVEGPQMSVREGSSGIMKETGTVDFGKVLQNTEAVYSFTIYNSGTSNLSIGTITVPTGYALVTSPPSTISAGTSGTFSLRLITANVGSASGTVSIETNVAGSDPFTFEIAGETIARVIDDGQVGYSTTGSWDYFSGIVGHDNDFEYFQYILGGSGSDVARWDFDKLVDGQYRVSTTWWAVGNRTTSAHYTILDGLNGAVLGAATLDQTLSPNDFNDQQTDWEDLGYVNVSGGKLLIELSNLAAANKYVIADAIRIERVGELPQVPKFTVQVENTGLVSNTSVYDFGSYQEGETATRTFTVHNTGATDLDIGTITIPNGFILLSSSPGILESGESVELVVQLDTATAAQYSGTFAIESNDTTQNPFQFVIRGTVEAEVGSGTNQPEIAVYHLDGIILDGTGSVPFGTVSQDASVSKTFVIKNVGDEELTISNFVVPRGYFLTSPPASTVAAGSQTSFTIQLDTIESGIYSGTVSFTTNDDDESLFNFNVSATVTARVVDNRDSGFSTAGGWEYFSSNVEAGREDDFYYNYQASSSGSGDEFAYWQFDGLSPGRYLISATWWASPNRTTAAQYSVLNEIGGTTKLTKSINQIASPNDFVDQGTSWENLGYVDVTDGGIVVQLSNLTAAGTYVIADAVRIERVWQGLTVDIQALDNQAAETPSSSAANTASFRISRRGGENVDTPLTVYFAVGGTATAGSDYVITGANYSAVDNYDWEGYYTGTTRKVVIAAGQSSTEIVITALNDNVKDALETAIVTLSNSSEFIVDSNARAATANIADNDQWVASIQATDNSAAELPTGETANTATFEITRTGESDLTHPLDVYFTVGGTATVGSDYAISGVNYSAVDNYDWEGYYVSTTRKVTLAAGQTSATLTVNALNDSAKEALETVTISLSANSYYTANVSARNATANIVDNDQWVASILAVDSSAAELPVGQTGNTATFEITRSGESDLTYPLEVYFTVAGTATLATDYTISGADYVVIDHYDWEGNHTGVTRKVVLAAGQASTQLTITALNDSAREALEALSLTLHGNANYTVVTNANTATANIVDNDQWVASIQAIDNTASELPTSQTPNTATFQIARSGETDLTHPLEIYLTVEGTAGMGEDYTISGADYVVIDHYDSEGNHYAVTRKVLLAAGQTSTQLTITALNDSSREALETVTVRLGGSSSYTLGINANSATANIVDNDQWIASIQAIDNSAAELPVGQTANNAIFEITRSGESDLTYPMEIHFAISGVASVGSDYTISGADYVATNHYDEEGYFAGTTRRVVLAAGQASTHITITALNDSLKEGQETVIATLIAGSYSLSTNTKSATANIVDNDMWVANIQAADNTAAELPTGQGVNNATFQISRSGESDLTYSLDVYFTLGGTAIIGVDYSLSGSTYSSIDHYEDGYYLGSTRKVTIAAGQSSTLLTLTVINDSSMEGTETATISLLSNDAYATNSGTVNATANILDDDQWIASVHAIDNSAAEKAASETPDTATFQITRNGDGSTIYPLDVYFSIGGSASLGNDYVISGSAYSFVDHYEDGYYLGSTRKVTIPAGQTSVQLTITALNDSVREGLETVTVTLSPNANYARDSNATTATMNVVDNDMWVASIQAIDNTAAETAAGQTANTAVFQITRGGETDLTFPLDVYFSMGGTASLTNDYTVSGPTYQVLSIYDDESGNYYPLRRVTIPAGQTSAQLTITALNDNGREGLETVTITLFGDANYGTNSSTISATANIVDNDVWMTNIQASDNTAAETQAGQTANTAVFQITRSGETDLTYPVDVYFLIAGTASLANDYTISGQTYQVLSIYDDESGNYYPLRKVTIPAGQTSAQLTITALNDSAREGLETVTITLFGDTTYGANSSAISATANIVDNDQWTVSVQAIDSVAGELPSSETPNVGTFQITRTGETDTTHAFDVYLAFAGTASLGVDFTISGANYQANTFYDEESGNYYTVRKVTIPAGQASVQFTITALNDNAKEGLETAIISIQSNPNYTVNSSAASATASIQDNDDQWVISIQAIDGIAQETPSGQSANTAVLEINRSGSTDTTFPLEVRLDFSGIATLGTDYVVTGATYSTFLELNSNEEYVTVRRVIIPSCQLSAQITVTAVNDSVIEPTETLVVALNTSAAFTLDNNAKTASVSILDANSPPTVEQDQEFDIPEDAVNGHVVGTVIATDPENDQLTYEITGGNSANIFEIDSLTGQISVLNRGLLDHETTPFYTLMIQVVDPTHTGTTPVAVTINVTDVNEAPAAVTLQNTTPSLAEDASTTTRTKIADIVITDDALGTNLISLSGVDAAFFEVVNGALYLKAGTTLDHESKPFYNVTVNVNDSSVGGSIDASTTFVLTITDVNEAPTAVTLQNTTPSLAEDTSTTTRIKVADVVITDDALGTNLISLSGTDAAFFEVVNGTLYLKAGTTLDHESKPFYNVTVNVNDSSVGGTVDASTSLTLMVADVNEAPTAVVLQNTTTSLAEDTNTTSRIKVGDVVITDDELGTNNISLSGTDASFFEVEDGVLYLKAGVVLDYEVQPLYSVTVNVNDSIVGGSVDATTTFTLTITDVNEAPILTPQTLSLNENTVGPLTFAFTDEDVDDVDLSVEVVAFQTQKAGIENPFDVSVDPVNRQLIITATDPTLIDFELNQWFELDLVVNNGNEHSTTETVRINVIDNVSEVGLLRMFAPSLGRSFQLDSSDEVDLGTLLINESQSFSFELYNAGNGDLQVSDVTAGSPVTISNLTLPTGLIIQPITFMLNVTPTQEGLLSSTITFQTEVGGLPRSSSIDVTADVISNLPPVMNDQTFSINEQTPFQSTIPLASDPNGDPLTYQIVLGNFGNAFSIDANGRLNVSNPTGIDYETSSTYTLEVVATDSQGASDTATITVIVNDIEERPVATPQTLSLHAGVLPGDSIGHVHAFDQDAGSQLSYAFEGSYPNFLIDAATGEISLVTWEGLTSGDIVLNATVSDGTFSTEFDITVIVETDNNPLPSSDTVPLTDYTVSYKQTDGITINPLAAYSGVLPGNSLPGTHETQRVTLQVKDKNGNWISKGTVVELAYGIIEILDDGQLKYTPTVFDPLATEPISWPETLEDGNETVVAYAASELPISFRLITADQVGKPDQEIASRADGSFTIKVTNSLPTVPGESLPHRENNYYVLDGRVYVSFDSIVSFDVNKFFNDQDGDSYRILGFANNPNASLSSLIDQDSRTFDVAGGGQDALSARVVSDSVIKFFNGADEFSVTSAMTAQPFLYYYLYVTSDAPGIDGNSHVEIIQLELAPRSTENGAWLGNYPDSRPWLTETFSSEFSVGEQDDQVLSIEERLVQNALTGWSVDALARTRSTDSTSLETVGPALVDLRNGQFLISSTFNLDKSGGGSELTLPGLIYDSATDDPRPVIQASIRRSSTEFVPTSIRATLYWYDENGSDNSPTVVEFPIEWNGVADEDYVIAIQPDSIPELSGVYEWKLSIDVTVEYIDEEDVLRTAVLPTTSKYGQSAVEVNRGDANSIGNGWTWGGIPSLTVSEYSNLGSTPTNNDLIMISFPGEAPKLFRHTLENNFNEVEIDSYLLGSNRHLAQHYTDPNEFGTLTGNGTELTYRDGNGNEYVFKKFGDEWLISRIEQTGVDFDPDLISTDASRRGLSFQRNQDGELQAIVSSDGSSAAITYNTANSDDLPGAIDYITLSSGETIDFKVDDNGDLSEISRSNSLSSELQSASLESFATTESFEYEAGKLTKRIWSSSNADSTDRITAFEYNHLEQSHNTQDLLSKISVGEGTDAITYQVQPLALAGLSRVQLSAGVFNGIVATSQLTASIKLNVTDLQKYEGTQATSAAGIFTDEYQYNLEGQKLSRKEIFEANVSTEPITLAQEKWTYDAIGSVKTYTDPLGRQTTYFYDYEIPVAYPDGDSDPSNSVDLPNQYDSDDYSGNIVKIVSYAGTMLFEYETDDEAGEVLGKLVKSIDPRGVVTEYLRDSVTGRLLEQRIIRGTHDGQSPPADDPVDSVQTWNYYTSGHQFAGLLESYTDVLGSTTTYEYDSNRRLVLAKTIDEGLTTAAADDEILYRSFSYDGLGYTNLMTSEVSYALDSTRFEISTLDYDFDSLGQLLRVRTLAPNNLVLTAHSFEYDAAGRVIGEIDGNGSRTEYVYDSRDLMISRTDAVGASFENALGEDVSIEQETSYSYYADGTLKLVTAPDQSTTQYLFDPTERQSWVITDGIAGQTTITSQGGLTHDFRTEVVQSTSDILGRTLESKNLLTGAQTNYEYGDIRHDAPTKIDELVNVGNLDSNATTPNIKHNLTLLSYDNLGSVTYQQASQTPAVTNHYDELGYLTRSEVTGAKYGALIQYETDAAGNVTRTTETRRSAINPTGTQFITTYNYDEQGRLRLVIDPLVGIEASVTTGAKTDYGFDSNKNMEFVTRTSREGFVTTQWFDAAGRLAEEQNVFGGLTTYEHDQAGNLTAVQMTGSDIQTRRTEYTYDELNRQTQIRQKSVLDDLVTTMEYYVNDITDNNTKTNWDVIVTSPEGSKQAATYDSVGNLVVALRFDPGVRADGTNPSDDTPLMFRSYSYNPSTAIVSVRETLTGAMELILDRPDSQNELRIAADADRRISIVIQNTFGLSIESYDEISSNGTPKNHILTSYDTLGRVESTSDGTPKGVISFDYDDDLSGTGKLIMKRSLRSSASSEQSDRIYDFAGYVYDSDGNLLQATSDTTPVNLYSSEGKTFATTYEYDQLNRLVKQSYGVDKLDTNGVKVTHQVERTITYEGKKKTETIKDLSASNNARVIETTFDPGQRQSIIEAAEPSSSVASITQTSTFNSQGEIHQIQESQFDPTANLDVTSRVFTSSFDYDEFGRLRRQIDQYSHSSALDETGKLPTMVSLLEYDANGNRSTLFIGVVASGAMIPDDATIKNDPLLKRTYDHDQLGRLSGMAQTTQSSTLWATNISPGQRTPADKAALFSYNVDGTLRQIIRLTDDNFLLTQASDQAGVTDYTYYEDGQLESLSHKRNQGSGASAIANHVFHYNNDSTVKSAVSSYYRADGTTKRVEISLTPEFDNKDRLRAYKRSITDFATSSTPSSINEEVYYDEVGNLIAIADPGLVMPPETVLGQSGHLLESNGYAYEYDLEGRVAKATRDNLTITYDYDPLGRLKVVTRNDGGDNLRIEYAYDALGRLAIRNETLNGDADRPYAKEGYLYDGSTRIFTTTVGRLGEEKILSTDFTGPGGMLLASDQVSMRINQSSHNATIWTFADPSATNASLVYTSVGGTISVVHRTTDEFGRPIEVYADAGQLDSFEDGWGLDVVQGRDHDAAAHLAWDGTRFQDLTSGRYLTATDLAFGGFTPSYNAGLDVARANQGRRPASQMQIPEGPGAFDDGLYGIPYTSGITWAVGNTAVFAYDNISEIGHFGLNAFGIVPFWGDLLADPLNATWYAMEGRTDEAALSAISAIPGLGYAANIALMSRQALSAARLASGFALTSGVAVNTGLGIYSGRNAISDFNQGNYIAGSLNTAGAIFGFAGAGLRAKELFGEFPGMNPLNYRPSTYGIGASFGNFRANYIGPVQFPVGRSGYKTPGEFADAVFSKYQQM